MQQSLQPLILYTSCTSWFSEVVQFLWRAGLTAQLVSISTKLGTAWLKHIQGQLLWLQGQVSEDVLRLKAVSTNFNVADIGTKALGRVKHLTMCYMLGLTDGGQAVGEHEYDRLCKEVCRKEEKQLVRQVCSDSRSTSAARNLVFLLAGMAQIGEGASMDGSSLEALRWLSIYVLAVRLSTDEAWLWFRIWRPQTVNVETEAYETSDVMEDDDAETQHTRVTRGDGQPCGEESGGDLRSTTWLRMSWRSPTAWKSSWKVKKVNLKRASMELIVMKVERTAFLWGWSKVRRRYGFGGYST